MNLTSVPLTVTQTLKLYSAAPMFYMQKSFLRKRQHRFKTQRRAVNFDTRVTHSKRHDVNV